MNKKIISFIAIILFVLAYTNNCIAASISELNEQKEQAQMKKNKLLNKEKMQKTN